MADVLRHHESYDWDILPTSLAVKFLKSMNFKLARSFINVYTRYDFFEGIEPWHTPKQIVTYCFKHLDYDMAALLLKKEWKSHFDQIGAPYVFDEVWLKKLVKDDQETRQIIKTWVKRNYEKDFEQVDISETDWSDSDNELD